MITRSAASHNPRLLERRQGKELIASRPMDQPPRNTTDASLARSFGRVAGVYDRARPSYPREAVEWMVAHPRSRVLELGAGTGKLTETVIGLGHVALATDPSEPMLGLLRERAPRAHPVLAVAEAIPVRSRSVDAVISGQAFHWFDTDRALPEIARVLRPGGVLALVWNERDERIPWVKRLGRVIGTPEQLRSPVDVIDASGLFGTVEAATFRFWQPLTQESLRELVASRSNIAVMSEGERAAVMSRVDELYDDYGRGADGMLLPYLTHAFRAPVAASGPSDGPGRPDELDTESLLIDFR